MARENMTELLSETICVTQAEAAAALEARDWNVLEAAQLLQQQARARARREREARAPESRSFRGLIRRFSRS